MNYLNKIAFLGKRKLQNYKPSSEWILCKADDTWPKEVQEEFNLSNDNEYIYPKNNYINVKCEKDSSTFYVLGPEDGLAPVSSTERHFMVKNGEIIKHVWFDTRTMPSEENKKIVLDYTANLDEDDPRFSSLGRLFELKYDQMD